MLIVFAFFKLFFTSQLVPSISRPDSGQIAFKNRTLPPCTFYGSGETKFPDKVPAEHCLALLVHDCIFVQIGLNVQANMIQSRNGQSQSEREQSKPRGRFTGQRLKLLRPETYRQAVELLAEPRQQVPYDHICRLLRVSEHTLKAIERAESLSIAERKQRLLSKALRIASKAADRVEDQIDGANITQATVAFGVATEKIMLLLGETGGVPVQLNLQVNAQLLHAKYAELVRKIEAETGTVRNSENGATPTTNASERPQA
jgi:hypothetical protein